MTFVAPLGLAALLVLPAILLVHFLRGSRRRVRVPALFLWADLPRAPAGRTRRRWPPLTLLLALQLAAGALAALALARPALPSTAPRHVALVLDASGSMQATDVSPTRFEAARTRALERVAGLAPTETVSVVRAGTTAALVAEGSPESVRAALQALQPGNGQAAIREALALASAQVARASDRRGEIVLLTDAAFSTPPSVGVLAAPVDVVAVGGGSENQAIKSVQVRMDPSGQAQTAFVEVANEADHAVRVPVRLTADEAPLDERQIDMAARSRTQLSVPLPVDARHISVRLLGKDALALDDVVDVLAPGGPPRSVLLLGRTSTALRRALESMPYIRLATPVGQPDLTVLEHVLPPQLPSGPLLVIDPPADSARLLGVGLGSGARVQAGHPLLAGLDVGTLQNESPLGSGVPGWARVVLGTSQGPLIMEGRLEGRSAVVLAFDPTLSGLEKSLAFPLLVSNATGYLLTQAEAAGRTPAEAFDVAESDIAPRAAPTFSSAPVRDVGDGSLERWTALLALAVVVLGAEWLVFARHG